jgi:pimeloyl-ACP methyl ester carboxylesterase
MGAKRGDALVKTIAIRSDTRLSVDDGGIGPAVVFLHGLSMFKEIWNDVLATVRRNGFRAIAYDQRGHGESSDPPPPWTIPHMAADLGLLLDQLQISSACFVGHSMGARCVFQFSLNWPQRVWAVVPVGGHSQAPPSPYREVLVRIREVTRREGLVGFRSQFQAIGEIPKRCVEDLIFAEKFNALFARNRADSLVAALDAILTMPNLTPRLKEIQVPALAVVGEYDMHFLELASYYGRAMPHCRTIIVPGCAHDPITDQTSFFEQSLVEFLIGEKPPT